ncbi:hypothetical protein [Bremerella cremea]|nr:hypothetical protein [Bremerella cremea]
MFIAASILSIALISWEAMIDRFNAVPSNLKTISEFREWDETAGESIDISVGGKRYMVVFGGSPLFPIKEYPAGYLFNEKGMLVAWSPEASDVDKYSLYWNEARRVLIGKAGGMPEEFNSGL